MLNESRRQQYDSLKGQVSQGISTRDFFEFAQTADVDSPRPPIKLTSYIEYQDNQVFALAQEYYERIQHARKALQEVDLPQYYFWINAAAVTARRLRSFERLDDVIELVESALEADKPLIAISVKSIYHVVKPEDFPDIDLTENKPISIPTSLPYFFVTNHWKGDPTRIEQSFRWNLTIDYHVLVDYLVEKLKEKELELANLDPESRQELIESMVVWLREKADYEYNRGRIHHLDQEAPYSSLAEDILMPMHRIYFPFIGDQELREEIVRAAGYRRRNKERYQEMMDLLVNYLQPVDSSAMTAEALEKSKRELRSVLSASPIICASKIATPGSVEWEEASMLAAVSRHRNDPELLHEVAQRNEDLNYKAH